MKVAKVEYILQAFENDQWHGLLNWVDQPEHANAMLDRCRQDDPTGIYRVDVRPYEVDYDA